MTHSIEPDVCNLHGCFSREREPIVTIASGDTIVGRTLDAGWGLAPFAEDVTAQRIDISRRWDPQHDTGHCLVGPIAVHGAQPGTTLEVQIHAIQPGPIGSTWVGEAREFLPCLGISDSCFIPWHIDVEKGVAQSRAGQVVELRPFLGVMGVAPAEPGYHPTRPPRACGGNIDCKELIAGSTLYLPIQVPEALFSFGDGHATQGDGEIGGTAIECPMSRVELSLRVRDDLSMDWPRAVTPSGWITFGFHPDLTEAMFIALNGMLDWMTDQLGVPRAEAAALASLTVDLRITQIVNRSLGVHAILPSRALDKLRANQAEKGTGE